MLVFTYGTLKKGFPNNYLLSASKFISDGITKEKFGLYPSINGRFPFAIESIKEVNIKGELWEIDKETEKQLDILEGYPFLYLKKEIEVFDENNEIFIATIYVKNEEFYTDAVDFNTKISEWK